MKLKLITASLFIVLSTLILAEEEHPIKGFWGSGHYIEYFDGKGSSYTFQIGDDKKLNGRIINYRLTNLKIFQYTYDGLISNDLTGYRYSKDPPSFEGIRDIEIVKGQVYEYIDNEGNVLLTFAHYLDKDIIDVDHGDYSSTKKRFQMKNERTSQPNK